MKTIYSLFVFLAIMLIMYACQGVESSESPKNLSAVATPSGSYNWGPWIDALNDGLTPADSLPWRPRGRRWRQTTQWIQYDWVQPVTTGKISVYFWDYFGVIPLPEAYHILYWDGSEFVPVANASGMKPENNTFNTILFDEVETSKLRLEVDSAFFLMANVLEWEVYQAENSPDHPPVVSAGGDRDLMLGGKTYLSGTVKSVTPLKSTAWKKVSGPGKVKFEYRDSLKNTATFSETGEYLLALTVTEGKLKSSDTLIVTVHQPPQEERLDVVYTKHYSINSPLWNNRAKALIVNWIPHCIDQINRTDLTEGQGGMDNFIEAAKALRGEPHGPHLGYVFSNAWVHQTVESICIALMIDPQGDREIIDAQEKMKATLPFIHRLVQAAGDFESGKRLSPLTLPGHALGVLICFEIIFPELARTQAGRGAEVLVNLTNDAWYGMTSAPFQHLCMAVFRAVENRRPLIRSANTGISAFIGSNGRILSRTELFEEEALRHEIRLPNGPVSFYTRRGDLFAVALLFIGLTNMLFILYNKQLRARRRDRRSPS